MKLYYSNSSDTESSFFFDNSGEENNFIQWLESLNISYLKTKYPAPNEKGEIVFKTSIVVITPKKNVVEEDVESEVEETVEEEEVVEEEQVQEEVEPEPVIEEEGKKKRKKSIK